ncbi:MAG: hypothetical protein J6C96_09865 [Oscillospiraceae bacterium]|nr:hypothetical protein [Oscillospiraceae bacterium]
MKTRRICAAIVSVILAAGLCTGAIYAAENKNTATPQTAVSADVKTGNAAAASEKNETVYIIAGADGSADKIIVSDHLKNTDGSSVITDNTTLSDIENVKGYEEFSRDGDNIVWAANGNDIYYQGTSTENAPVGMKVTYTLDGKEISPSELAGKSGKIKIRVDYANTLTVPTEINGVTENVCVPFAVVTGTVLDNDKFRNIEVSSGKVLDDGDRTVIAALSFPSLQESLDIDKEKLDIPDYLEITADVTDFEFGGFYAAAESGIFADISLDGENTLDDLKNAAAEMNSAMAQLMDGSSRLYNGLTELNSKTGELIDGISALSEGAAQLSSGAAALDEGAAGLSKGIAQLDTGSSQLSAGLAELDKNSAALNEGANQIFASLLAQADSQLAAQGLELPKLTADNYTAVLDGAAKQIEQAMGKDAAAGITAVKAQLDEVKGFCDGLNVYTSGVSSASAGAQNVYNGTVQLSQGADKLKDGASSLKDGTAALSDGIGTLAAGGSKMAEGISALTEGAGALNDGLIKFNDEAVQKLVDAANGDLGGLTERLNAVSDAAESYRSYSGITDETSGSVKFIFRTDEIKNAME